MKVQLSAPAKINLFLEVFKRNVNGYHTIETVFQEINLFDRISLKVEKSNKSEIEISCSDLRIPPDTGNLAFRAARSFLDYTGIKARIEIEIKKNIPIEAGLGGGSSDAACVLKGLNVFFKKPLSQSVLVKAGRQIGMDVPFFLWGGTALGTGYGDIIKPLSYVPKLAVVLVKPPLGISTSWVYENLVLTKNKKNVKLLIHTLHNNDLSGLSNYTYNALEKTVFRKYRQIEKIKEEILYSGAEVSLLSGSGSAVYGLVRDSKKSEEIKEVLSRKYTDCWVWAGRMVGRRN